MDEYIKREDALKALQCVRDCLADSILKHRHIPDYQKEVFEAIISAAERVINRIPAADVVPKSEVERLENEIKALLAFKDYFSDLYGHGLEVANWHENGTLEPFDNFYDSAEYEYEAELKKKYTEGEPNGSK